MIELLVIGATIVVVLFILIPTLWHKREEEVCRHNLKDIGVAFRISEGNGGNYLTHESVSFGGTLELVGSGQAFVHFRAMSNELITPKILVCPSDEGKVPAKDFDRGFGETNVSYFVGADASDVLPQAFLSGDRNLASNGVPIRPGSFALFTNTPLGWTKSIHHSRGHVLLADGSVQFYDSPTLAAAVRNQGATTNRLAVP